MFDTKCTGVTTLLVEKDDDDVMTVGPPVWLLVEQLVAVKADDERFRALLTTFDVGDIDRLV